MEMEPIERTHSAPQTIFNYGSSCRPCSGVHRSRSIIPNLVFDFFFYFIGAQKYPGSVTTSQRSPITPALLQRRTLIGYLDLSYTVADPKRDFRACSYLCVGILDRLLLNDTPISNTDLEFVALFTFFACI